MRHFESYHRIHCHQVNQSVMPEWHAVERSHSVVATFSFLEGGCARGLKFGVRYGSFQATASVRTGADEATACVTRMLTRIISSGDGRPKHSNRTARQISKIWILSFASNMRVSDFSSCISSAPTHDASWRGWWCARFAVWQPCASHPVRWIQSCRRRRGRLGQTEWLPW